MIPTSSAISLSIKNSVSRDVDAICVFLPEGAASVDSKMVGADERRAAERLLRAGVVRGKAKELAFDLIGDGKKARRVYLAGLGEAKKLDADTVRQSAAALAKALRKHRIGS